MQQLVRAFPILDGKEDEFRAFVAELAARQPETDAFYKGFGVQRETAHLCHSSVGTIVIVCSEVQDLDANLESYAKSNQKFDAWFKARIKSFSGVDMDAAPAGPPSELLMDWRRVDAAGTTSGT